MLSPCGSDRMEVSEDNSHQDLARRDPEEMPQQALAERESIAESPSRLYFVRHGRSIHNESKEERPLIWDAALHKLGIRQAAMLRQQLAGVPLEVAVTSPLTRAIQTALIALGHWSQLSPEVGALCDGTLVTVKRIRPTVQVDESGARFDASDDEVEPLEGQRLGPGSRVRLLKDVKLESQGTLKMGSNCTVTNAVVTLEGMGAVRSCLDVFPTAALRCKVFAWPEATEQLHESDDLGSPAPELRQRFPSVDFSRLPQDNSTWWWSDPKLPATLDAMAARTCWEQHGRRGMSSRKYLYDEPDCHLEERIGKLIHALNALAVKHRHIAIFAHCWVLDEIWCQRFGKGRRFDNAEVAVVEVLQNGDWRWLRFEGDEDSSD